MSKALNRRLDKVEESFPSLDKQIEEAITRLLALPGGEQALREIFEEIEAAHEARRKFDEPNT